MSRTKDTRVKSRVLRMEDKEDKELWGSRGVSQVWKTLSKMGQSFHHWVWRRKTGVWNSISEARVGHVALREEAEA